MPYINQINVGGVLYDVQDLEASTAVPQIKQMISNVESSPATAAHAAGSYLIYNNTLYRASAAIAVGDALTVGTNIAAVSGGLAGDVADLKSAFDETVLDKMEYVEPANWFDSENATVGISVYANGTTQESSSSLTTDYIPVSEGDQIKVFRGDNFTAIYRTHICLYNASKTVVTGGSDSTSTAAFTVPAGVSYVRLSFNKDTIRPVIVRDGVTPTSYTTYFEPYYEITDDFITNETKEKIESVPDNIAPATVKGANLIAAAETGVGAYFASGSTIVYRDTGSYANYRYAIIPINKNTLYSLNFITSWYILAGANNEIISSGTKTAGYYVESGEAVTLYATFSAAAWNAGVIVAEGVSGRSAGMVKPEFVSGLNQLVFDSWYAVALPLKALHFTQNLNEKFYYDNIFALDKNSIAFFFGGQSTSETDGILINPATLTSGENGYYFTVLDDNLSVVQNTVNYTNSRFVSADNPSDCSALAIGDSTVAQNTMVSRLVSVFSDRNKTITMLGTRGTGQAKHEGRSGWSTVDYLGGSERGRDTAQNPFYNPATEAFDFGYYMQQQGYAAVDFVIIQLGINDLYNSALSDARNKIESTAQNICAMVDSILSFNANQKIILNLPTPCNGSAIVPPVERKILRAKFANYNALMQLIATKYGIGNVRCSYCHLILDPYTDINDNIHPNAAGYGKMALEIFSQINCWQNES